jgi:hypothetical protein
LPSLLPVHPSSALLPRGQLVQRTLPHARPVRRLTKRPARALAAVVLDLCFSGSVLATRPACGSCARVWASYRLTHAVLGVTGAFAPRASRAGAAAQFARFKVLSGGVRSAQAIFGTFALLEPSENVLCVRSWSQLSERKSDEESNSFAAAWLGQGARSSLAGCDSDRHAGCRCAVSRSAGGDPSLGWRLCRPRRGACRLTRRRRQRGGKAQTPLATSPAAAHCRRATPTARVARSLRPAFRGAAAKLKLLLSRVLPARLHPACCRLLVARAGHSLWPAQLYFANSPFLARCGAERVHGHGSGVRAPRATGAIRLTQR